MTLHESIAANGKALSRVAKWDGVRFEEQGTPRSPPSVDVQVGPSFTSRSLLAGFDWLVVDVPIADARRIEVVANGLPLSGMGPDLPSTPRSCRP